jgi:membrane protease YdiL (CAAX protease family)
MSFISLAKNGRKGAKYYVWTLLLIFTTTIGVGQLPYYLGLWAAGIEFSKVLEVSMQDAIAILGSNLFFTLELIPFCLLLGVLLFSLKKIHGRPLNTVFTIREYFDWKRFFFLFVLWFLILATQLVFSYWTGAKIEWNANKETFLMLCGISLFILPLQVLFEEVLFRSYILQGLALSFKRPLLSIILSGTLFGLLHAANPEVDVLGNEILMYYIVTGLFLGVLTVMDDGLELSLGFHTANNIFGALIVTTDWQVFKTDALMIDNSPPVIGLDMYVTLFGVFPLVLLLLSKKYKWNSFSKLIIKQ